MRAKKDYAIILIILQIIFDSFFLVTGFEHPYCRIFFLPERYINALHFRCSVLRKVIYIYDSNPGANGKADHADNVTVSESELIANWSKPFTNNFRYYLAITRV